MSAAASRCASSSSRRPTCCSSTSRTNHLDAESVLWLEQHLASYPGAVIAVTHDRYFLDHVAGWIAEVDRGHLYPYEGNYSTYLETKEKRLRGSGAEGCQAGQAPEGRARVGSL